jgi:hypothetical protein
MMPIAVFAEELLMRDAADGLSPELSFLMMSAEFCVQFFSIVQALEA